jgi:hypothetical protein
MNIHNFLDHYTAILATLLAGRRKFFDRSVESRDFADLLATTTLRLPDIGGEGSYEVAADTVAGTLDPAFYVAQWLGPEHPTLIYHHGNNERPFDFGPLSKNTFKHVILKHRQTYPANLIALRAPFHRSLRTYMEQMTELRNFAAMLAVSVKLAESLTQWSRAQGSPRVLLTGASLGGWVTNLHRTYYNTADFYAPMMAGAALDEVFTRSAYRRLTGRAAHENPEVLHRVLNFEDAFAAVPADNVTALLMRYDAFIVYERQNVCYDPARVTVLDKGHTTGALAFAALRAFLLAQIVPFQRVADDDGKALSPTAIPLIGG